MTTASSRNDNRRRSPGGRSSRPCSRERRAPSVRPLEIRSNSGSWRSRSPVPQHHRDRRGITPQPREDDRPDSLRWSQSQYLERDLECQPKSRPRSRPPASTPPRFQSPATLER
eukprot:11405354-Karenia_brevis.AAC.1